MQRSYLALVVLSNLALTPFYSSANDNKEEPTEVIVVTGTRTEKPLLETPVRTEVITQQELQKIHAANLEEALRFSPGVVLRTLRGKTSSEVLLQGFSGNRVLILIDGEPVIGTDGGAVDLGQIPTSTISHIEIVKGASSALYGSAAMGGVINVITKRPEDNPAAIVNLTGGRFDNNVAYKERFGAHKWRGFTQLSGSAGAHQASISFDYKDIGGFDYLHRDNIKLPENHPLYNHYRTMTFGNNGEYGNKRQWSGKYYYTHSEQFEWFVKSSYYDQQLRTDYARQVPGFGIFRVRQKTFDMERTHFTVGNNFDAGDWNAQSKIIWEQAKDHQPDDDIQTAFIDLSNDATHETKKLETNWSYFGFDNFEVVYGLSWQEKTLKTTKSTLDTVNQIIKSKSQLSDKANRSTEGYVQVEWDILPEFTLLTGGRYQHDSQFGSHFSPKLSLQYRLEDVAGALWNFRQSIAQGYRTATLREQYYLFDHREAGYLIAGNKNLEPEESLNFQLGAEVIWDAVTVDVNYFYNEIEKLISAEFDANLSANSVNLYQTDTPVTVYHYKNIDEATTQGVEANITWRITDKHKLRVGQSYLDSEDKSTGKPLKNRPKHQIQVAFDTEPFSFPLNLSLRYTAEKDSFDSARTKNNGMQNWNRLDFKANYQLDDAWRVYGGIDNVGDQHRDYLDSTDIRPAQGRYYYLGVEFKWL